MPKVAKVCKAAQYEAAPLAKFDYCLTVTDHRVFYQALFFDKKSLRL